MRSTSEPIFLTLRGVYVKDVPIHPHNSVIGYSALSKILRSTLNLSVTLSPKMKMKRARYGSPNNPCVIIQRPCPKIRFWKIVYKFRHLGNLKNLHPPKGRSAVRWNYRLFIYMEWAKGGRPQRPWRPQLSFIVNACYRRPKFIEDHHSYFLSQEYAWGEGGGRDQQKLKLPNMTWGLERQTIVWYFMT